MGKLLDMLQEANLNVLDLRGEMPTNPNVPWNLRNLSDIRGIVVHHTGGWRTATPYNLARWHIEKRGFPGLAYTFYLRYPYMAYPPNVEWAFCHKLREWGPHAKGVNAETFGVGLGGNYEDSEPPIWMVESLKKLIEVLQRFFEEETGNELWVLPHFSVIDTVCPGKVWDVYQRLLMEGNNE